MLPAHQAAVLLLWQQTLPQAVEYTNKHTLQTTQAVMIDTSTLINNALINKQINNLFVYVTHYYVMLSSLWCSFRFVVGVSSVSASNWFQGGELRPPLLKLLDQLLPLKLSRLLHDLPHKPSPNVHRPSHCLQVLENGIIVCREREGERGREREDKREEKREIGRPCSQSHLLPLAV